MNEAASSDTSILLVDDIPENLRLLTIILETKGYKVRVATSGQRAIQSALLHPPALILLDIILPDLSGQEVCRRLKGGESTRDIPILFISALDDVRTKLDAFAAGGVDYITKPFQTQEVLARVQTHLTLRSLQKALQDANQALAGKVAELEVKNAELDAFAHTLAHDLKHPVNALLLSTQLLQDEQWVQNLPPDDLVTIVRPVARSAAKLNEIIESILLLAGVRKASVQIKPLAMGKIVAESCQRLKGAIEQAGAEICLPGTWPVAVGYAPWVEEVWANYLSNALKYGGQPPRIELGAASLPGRQSARFWIKDNGPGLSAADCQRLFTPFTRIHTDRAEGHGLGLSIVQRIVERLNGQVGVESQPGQGSMFYFDLPLAEGAVVSGGA